MRAVTILSLVALLALSASSPVLAAAKPDQLHHRHGEIVNVDAAAKSLSVKETLKDGKTKEYSFIADEKTKVMVHGKAGKLEDLKTGDSVKVSYHKKGTENHVEAIAVVAAPAKKS